MANMNTIEGRRQGDLARVISRVEPFEPVTSQLMKVVSSIAIDSLNWRYRYTVRRAQVGATPNYVPAVTTNSATETALSVSELSNTLENHVAYGVSQTNIPQGFTPQAIPNNTFVVCFPHRCTDGALIWLIANTQAIDGTCAGGLTEGDDYGTFSAPQDISFDGGTFDAEDGSWDYGTYTDDYGLIMDANDLVLNYGSFAVPLGSTDYGAI